MGLCAGPQGVREGYTALYLAAALLRELAIARGDGSYGKRLNRFARADVLVLDDWGLVPIGETQRRDLYEILEDRWGRARRSSPASTRSRAGTSCSASRRWPTPSSTGSSTAPTASP